MNLQDAVTQAARTALAAAFLLMAGGALAAGGHHAVDDASILARGSCEAESWVTRSPGAEQLLHANLNCGVGPLELGVGVERARAGDTTGSSWLLEAKWVREIGEEFSIGLDAQPGWLVRQRPRQVATVVTGLATWRPREDLGVHFNLGRELVRGGPDLARGGVAVEWAPAKGWSLLAERFLLQRTHFARVGVRWAAGERWSVDLSRAERLSGPLPSNWTLGVTVGFGGE